MADLVERLLDPNMPAQELRLHMGEMTAQEMRTARAVIRWANTRLAAALEAEASKGERRGLERAAKVAEDFGEPYALRTATGAMMFRACTEKIAAAIRALIPEAPVRDSWQPIETAPRNRAIQIHVPSLDYYGNGGVYAGMLVDMGTGRRWMTFGWAIGRDLGHENTPTHWRPLPPPPSQDREPDSQRGAK